MGIMHEHALAFSIITKVLSTIFSRKCFYFLFFNVLYDTKIVLKCNLRVFVINYKEWQIKIVTNDYRCL